MIRIWDLADPSKPQVLEGSPVALTSVAFHKGGMRLASAGADNTVRLWDLITGQEILELQVPAGPLRSVAFSPDGRRLASASEDNTMRLWISSETEEEAAKRLAYWRDRAASST